MPGREEKFSVLKLGHNFSIFLRLHTHYESNVLTASTTITTTTTTTTIHLSYVLCQLSSKPADQKDVTSVRDVNYHSLTHIGIISPVLQKTNVCNITSIERIEDFK
jgi:hypothetical protein